MKKLICLLSILFLTLSLAGEDYSTSAGRFLLLNSSARGGALGGAYSAVGEDASAITWNPGGLGAIKSLELSFMHMTYGEDISYEYAAATFPLEFGTFGLNFIYMGMTPLIEFEPTGSEETTGNTLTYYNMAVAVSFGREFLNTYGFGINVKFIKNAFGIEDSDKYVKGQGFAIDLGMLARFDLFKFYRSQEKNLRAGITVQNIGPELKYNTGEFPLPMVIRPGLFYKPIRYAEAMIDYNIITDSPDTLNIGVEAMPEWILSPRAGIKIGERAVYTFGMGLKYHIGSFLFQFDYAYNLDSESYFNTHILSLALKKFSSSLAEFSIGDIVINDVFPAMYKYYTKTPVTKVEIKNNTNIPIEKIKVTMFVNKNMDFPSESEVISTLAPGREVTVELPAEFNNEVLKVTEETPVQAQIKVNYIAEGKREQLTKTKSFKMYNRYAMTWDNFNKLAAFITPKDTPIKTFARGIAQRYSTQKIIKGVPNTIIQAALIFDALGALGMTYVLDPQSAYRKKGDTVEIVDQIQYPRDTLRFKTGDCDDCMVLFCALLENIGFNTAFIDVQDHIFMMFDTQIPAEEALLKFGNEDLYIIKDQTAWLPIETTMFNKGFTEAWNSAADTYLKASSEDLVTIIDIKDAWKNFYPVTLPETKWESPFPPRKKMNQFLMREQKIFSSLDSSKIINNLKAELKKDPKNTELLNKLGVLYGRLGNMETALKYLGTAVKISPKTAKYCNNLANTYFLNSQLEEALEYYKKAVELEPGNPNYRINLSNLYNVMGETDKAEEELKNAEKLLK